jgi:hypothetical protein
LRDSGIEELEGTQMNADFQDKKKQTGEKEISLISFLACFCRSDHVQAGVSVLSPVLSKTLSLVEGS